ncbi:MAG: 16S rRNA (guanine(527)-N(7))-methyltransferase RsmG [Bdellovibrionota bacterium]
MVDPQDANVVPNWRIDSWFPDIPEATRAVLKTYWDELIKANRLLNLIPIKSIANADAIHFADSILASRLIFADLKSKEIVDIGSGNGFPGLVFAILYPQVKMTLVDFDPKKCEFLNNIVGLVGLKNVEVQNVQIDKLPQGSVLNAMMRGVGSLTKTLILCRRLMHSPSNLYHVKSENWGMELADIPSQLCSTFEPSLLAEYRLPIGEQKYAVVKTIKIKQT